MSREIPNRIEKENNTMISDIETFFNLHYFQLNNHPVVDNLRIEWNLKRRNSFEKKIKDLEITKHPLFSHLRIDQNWKWFR